MRGIHSLGVAVLVCALSGVAAGHGQGKLEYRLSPLVVPTQFGEVFPVDITNAGVILGQPVNVGSFGVLFFGRLAHTFTVPGARLLFLSAMTTSGSVLVNMFDTSGTLMPFLRSPRGGITPLTVDGTWFQVQAMDISENGTVVGYAVETPGGPVRGFVLDRSGTRLLDIPGGTYVTPTGVNAVGVIVGTAQDDQFTTTSFIVDRGGHVKKLMLPGVDSTVFVDSINDLGVIVGRYGDFTNTRGFILRDNALTTITYDAPPHITYQDPSSGQTVELARINQFTDVARINDWNQIVGATFAAYSDDSGALFVQRVLPFVGTPVLRR